jgi:hypothetical protein
MRASILSGEKNGVGVVEDAVLIASPQVDDRHPDLHR